MRALMLFVTATALTALPCAAVAQWSDNFDSYATGSSLHGQGGWKGWGNSAAYTAYTSDTYAISSPNSVKIEADADLVHEYGGYTSGQWVYTAWQYIPTSFSGQSYFILLNTYDDAGVNNNWSVQVRFDSSIGKVESEFEGAQLPLILGQWVELRNEIDLDANTLMFYYGGQLLTSKTWTEGVSGGGALNIGAVDLFANGAMPIYYDNMSLIPEPATSLLVVLGAALGLRRR